MKTKFRNLKYWFKNWYPKNEFTIKFISLLILLFIFMLAIMYAALFIIEKTLN